MFVGMCGRIPSHRVISLLINHSYRDSMGIFSKTKAQNAKFHTMTCKFKAKETKCRMWPRDWICTNTNDVMAPNHGEL